LLMLLLCSQRARRPAAAGPLIGARRLGCSEIHDRLSKTKSKRNPPRAPCNWPISSGCFAARRGYASFPRQDASECGQDGRAPCADETMKPTSESLSPTEARYRRVAKIHCVAAMRGGEQIEAKHRSQTKVNSIRLSQRASWRRDRICRAKPRGVLAKPGPLVRSACGTSRVQAVARALRSGWSENGGRCHGLSQDRCRRAEKAADDRAPIVAKKRVTTVERRGVGR
jgi:hypothetical protein